ncbi:hypothetical protein PWT90_08495 [Aphanocladium album]|nr:hypothetical protein PWT90_08495 [Aphanocladium album]
MGPYGVRALQAVGSNAQACEWARRIEETPISERLVAGSELTSLRVTLDGYKITAPAVLARTPAETVQKIDEEAQSPALTQSLRKSAIWYPELPPRKYCYQPLSWIRFGGDSGSRLPLVQGLTPNFIFKPNGLRFDYENTVDEMRNASLWTLGSVDNDQPVNLPVFAIDGAGGERISSVSVGLGRESEDGGPDFLRHGTLEYLAVRILCALDREGPTC